MGGQRPSMSACQLCVRESWLTGQLRGPQRAVLAGRPTAHLEEPLLQRLGRNTHAGQHPDGRTILVVQYPEQDMLGAQAIVS